MYLKNSARVSVSPGINQVTVHPMGALSPLKPQTVTITSTCLLCHVLLVCPVTTLHRQSSVSLHIRHVQAMNPVAVSHV